MYYGVMDDEAIWEDTETFVNVDFAENYNWPGDGKFDNETLPSGVDVDVAVSRIDFYDLRRLGTTAPNDEPGQPFIATPVSETNLLKRYLDRNHAYRTGGIDINQQALIESVYTPTSNLAFNYDESSAVLLSPVVGSDNILEGDWEKYGEAAPSSINGVDDSWMWGFGGSTGALILGDVYERLDGTAGDPITSTASYQHSNRGPHKIAFNMFFGSYVGDWDKPSSLMRAPLAENDGYGLASMFGYWPTSFHHGMGLGDSLGDGLLRSQNNTGTEYRAAPSESLLRNTYISLLGDATLRQHIVKPVSDVTVATHQAGSGGSAVVTTTIEWEPSPDGEVAGYYVYRSDSFEGPFTLLNGTLETGTSYQDSTANPGDETYYMVRAAKLEETPSGSYWNLSTGQTSRRLVEISNFVWNEPPQSFTFRFHQDVESILTDSNFAIAGETWNNSTQTFTPISFVAGTDFELVDYDGDVATLRFLGQSELGVSNTLPSGRYTISVEVETESELGQTILSTHAQDILFVAGDTNNDGIVDFDDLLVVSQNYNQTTPNWASSFGVGDFDNDDDVDFDDLLILGQYYGLDLN